jgi:hypothetical protein
MKRVIAALNLPRRIHDFIAYARLVATSLGKDPIFVSPTPSLASFEGAVAALEAADVAATIGGPGARAERDAKRAFVHQALHTLKNYVQHLADANGPEAAAIVQRAGMSVKDARGPSKLPFDLKQGPVSGSLRLRARAAKTRVSYDWQYSLDGESYVDFARTVRADAELKGLVPGTRVFVRYRCVSKAGVSDWSQVLSLVVGGPRSWAKRRCERFDGVQPLSQVPIEAADRRGKRFDDAEPPPPPRRERFGDVERLPRVPLEEEKRRRRRFDDVEPIAALLYEDIGKRSERFDDVQPLSRVLLQEGEGRGKRFDDAEPLPPPRCSRFADVEPLAAVLLEDEERLNERLDDVEPFVRLLFEECEMSGKRFNDVEPLSRRMRECREVLLVLAWAFSSRWGCLPRTREGRACHRDDLPPRLAGRE